MLNAIYLVATLCLASAPSEGCQKEVTPWEGSLMQCMLFGQQQIAQRLRGRSDLSWDGRYKCVSQPVGGENVG